MKTHYKHLIAVIVFLLLTIAYFNPLFGPEKTVINQSDKINHKGGSQEIIDHRETYDGEDPLWTNSMFSGMPAYLISVKWEGNLLKYVDGVFKLYLPKPAGIVFLYMLGFYFLLVSLSIDYRISIIGAMAFAMSSYFFIILEAGHNTKAHTIAYMAPLLASVLMTYRGKLLLGGGLTSLFVSLILYANHPQITYYLVLVLIVIGCVYFYDSYRNKCFKPFLKSVGVLFLAALLGALTNFDRLKSTYEYGEISIRGPSELSSDKENKTSGLDKDYALEWSYGVMETFNLISPNLFGGSSSKGLMGPDQQESNTMKWIRNNSGNNGVFGSNPNEINSQLQKLSEDYANQTQRSFGSKYWGEQPFTSGPVYIGSVVFFLFVLSLFIVKGSFRNWIIISLILAIMLSWGKNFSFLTNIFLDYFPGYNKFRAVSTILVVVEFLIPLLAFYGLHKILIKYDNLNFKNIKRSFYIVGGICVLFYILPTLIGSFSSSVEQKFFSADQYVQYSGMQKAMAQDRMIIARSDLLRSFILIFLCFGLFYFLNKKKLKLHYFIIALGALLLFDMWSVNKRYLNTKEEEKHFIAASEMEDLFAPNISDKMIYNLEGIDWRNWKRAPYSLSPNFRVYNANVNTFNNASTSYHWRSIGGYHGAKLRRYQELIENHISINNFNIQVLNMLNTKYFISPGGQVQQNPEALGNAWFVSNYRIANTADQEINLLDSIDPNITAIISSKDKHYIDNYKHQDDGEIIVNLSEYKANNLKYNFSSPLKSDKLIVFSEIFYNKGWNAYIDGKKRDYFRANYVLRSMIVPKNTKEIEFKFEPKVIPRGRPVAYASSSLLIILLLGILFKEFRNKN